MIAHHMRVPKVRDEEGHGEYHRRAHAGGAASSGSRRDKRPNSNAITRVATTRPQRLIAEPSTNMRTIANMAKKHTKTMTPTIRFFRS
jgi:hypothetical protein